MAEDWLADVRKYVADADEKVVGAIVKYLGIALRNRDSSLVSFSDKKETDRVRTNYLKKKLGLTQDNATLDAAIAAVGERMKADRTKNRVTVYYLLADHFGVLGTFGGAAKAAAGAVATAAAAATAAPVAASPASAPQTAFSAPKAKPERLDAGMGWGWLWWVLGGIILAAFLAMTLRAVRNAPDAAPAAPVAAPAAPATPEAAATPAVAIPEGAGVIAGDRDGKPMLTVYFDTGKADVTNDLAAAAAGVKAHVAANPGAKLAVSGFNDPTGNAALNAELSKNRAQAVAKALADAGIPAGAIELVKPADTTIASGDNSAARRVEVTVQ